MNNLKKIWFSPITLIITIAQILFPMCQGKIIFSVSLVISIVINILATILINYSINWYKKHNKDKEAELYIRSAPCAFQALKFSMGIIISSCIAIINLFIEIDGINAAKLIVTWFFVPLVLVFVSCIFFDIGLYDEQTLGGKIRKMPLFCQKFFLSMFDLDDNGKIKINKKGILSSIALILLVAGIGFYFVNIIINIFK